MLGLIFCPVPHIPSSQPTSYPFSPPSVSKEFHLSQFSSPVVVIFILSYSLHFHRVGFATVAIVCDDSQMVGSFHPCLLFSSMFSSPCRMTSDFFSYLACLSVLFQPDLSVHFPGGERMQKQRAVPPPPTTARHSTALTLLLSLVKLLLTSLGCKVMEKWHHLVEWDRV